MTEYEFHPIANIFPILGDVELGALASDIHKRGMVHPIVLFEGKILDGRNRYLACRMAGLEITRFDEYDGNDPVGEVVSLNLHRRHLDESQRAMVATAVENLRLGDNQFAHKGRCRSTKTEGSSIEPSSASVEPPSFIPVNRERAAEMLNVSRATVQRAAQVKKLATPNVIAAIERGEVSVMAAVDAVRNTPKDQQAAWSAKDIKDAASKARREKARAEKSAAEADRWTMVDALPTLSAPVAPSANLNLCRFLLRKITDEEDRKELRDLVFSLWNQLMEKAYTRALAELSETRAASD